MSNYDTGYVRAETTYRAQRLRDQIADRSKRTRLRRERTLRRKGMAPWD